MNFAKITTWVVLGFFCLFLLWFAGFFLSIGLGIIGVIVSLAGLLLKLAFSKVGLFILCVCLIAYIFSGRSKERMHRSY